MKFQHDDKFYFIIFCIYSLLYILFITTFPLSYPLICICSKIMSYYNKIQLKKSKRIYKQSLEFHNKLQNEKYMLEYIKYLQNECSQ